MFAQVSMPKSGNEDLSSRESVVIPPDPFFSSWGVFKNADSAEYLLQLNNVWQEFIPTIRRNINQNSILHVKSIVMDEFEALNSLN